MNYNFDEVIDRRGTCSEKVDGMVNVWGKSDLIPMWVADMDFATPPFILEAIRKRCEHPVLGGSEVEQTQDALRDVLAQIREDHDAEERHVQHPRTQQRQRDGDDPETCKVEDHARQRIAAGAEHAHDLHIGDIAEAVFQRAEDRHGVGR